MTNQRDYDLRRPKAIRLDDEMAARVLGDGQWYIFAYEDDEGEIHEMIRASHVILSELACMNLTDAICRRAGDCDLLKDTKKDGAAMLWELKSLEWIVDEQTIREDGPTLLHCPNCGGYKHNRGHTDECSLDATIRGCKAYLKTGRGR